MPVKLLEQNDLTSQRWTIALITGRLGVLGVSEDVSLRIVADKRAMVQRWSSRILFRLERKLRRALTLGGPLPREPVTG